ncbi:MAG: glycosyltransferase family 39 protein [Anaerolineae bacterium]|nr:glycosyltransferase family 39 protein [Anaerolineae bacterium]
MPQRPARAGLAVLVLLLIGAFGLRLWDLGGPSIWHDEAWSIRAIRDPIHTPDDNTPPVYYAVMHVLWLGAGDTAFALRFGSVLLDLITIALAAQLVRRWSGWDTALLTAVLLAASPLLWAYAREVRAYVAVPLLALVLLWFTDALLEPRERFPWRVWGGLLLTELILLYTHNLSVPVVGWLNLVVIGAWAYRRQWRALVFWLSGQAVLLAAYVPWLLSQSPSGTPLNTPPRLDFSLARDIWQAYFAPLPTQLGADNALVIGSAVFGIVALVGMAITLDWHRNRHTLLVLSQAVIIPVLATVELHAAHIDFHPRYYLAGVPAALMLVALSVDALPGGFEFRRVAIPALVALAAGVAAASLIGLLNEVKYQHDDFRAMAEHYATLPADAIILVPYGWEPALEEYYADKVGIRAEILGVDLHSSAETAVGVINAALAERNSPAHVELLTWYQLPADVRGMYPCLLEAAGQRLDNAYTVQGITTQGYSVSRPLVLVEVPDFTAEYGPVTLAGAALEGEQSVCLRTVWQLRQPGDENWRVAGRLLTTDPPGWIIARSDTDIRADDQALTAQWDANDRGDAFSLLRFPAGTPPGEYTVQIGVYSENNPRGLDRLIDGVPSGPAVRLTTVRPVGTTCAAEHVSAGEGVVAALNDGVELTGHDAHGGALSSGQELRITLRWRAPGDCREPVAWTEGTLTLRGRGWELSQPVAAYPAYSLDWHAFVIPPDVSGPVTLTVESDNTEPVELATYTIRKTDRLLAPPPVDVPVGATFRGMGTLEGFSVDPVTVSPDGTLDLTLVWRAESTPSQSYRVFTHLLDADGRVIAQHDGYPADETRLTTGWVPGEYIVDRHVLAFQYDDYTGPARLEVGFYNPETSVRVRLLDGADHLILPIEITVQ